MCLAPQATGKGLGSELFTGIMNTLKIGPVSEQYPEDKGRCPSDSEQTWYSK